MTPKKLAANRANAGRSTGPRTAAGKRQVMLNSLRHGRSSRAFRETLVRAGEDVGLFDWIHERVLEAFPYAASAKQSLGDQQALGDRQVLGDQQASGDRRPSIAELLARQVWSALRTGRKAGERRQSWPVPERASLWCLAWTPWRAGGQIAEPRYLVKSTDTSLTFLSQIPAGFHFRIVDPANERRLTFWVRRRRGSLVRIPLDSWPEIAAWRLWRKLGLSAGERAGLA